MRLCNLCALLESIEKSPIILGNQISFNTSDINNPSECVGRSVKSNFVCEKMSVVYCKRNCIYPWKVLLSLSSELPNVLES